MVEGAALSMRAGTTGRADLPASGRSFRRLVDEEAFAWRREFIEASRFASHLAMTLGPAILKDTSALVAAVLFAAAVVMGGAAIEMPS